MRHNNKNKILKREKGARRALLAAISQSLVKYEKIETTSAKAKAARPLVERLITAAKTGGISNRRRITSVVGSVASKKLFEVIGPRYKDRFGGYTRILKRKAGRSDNASAVIMELV